jgi:SAM-dependent methyltransferase
MRSKAMTSSIFSVFLALSLLTITADAKGGNGEVELPPDVRSLLLKEMNLLQDAMRELVASIAAGDWEATERTGSKMADSFIFKQEMDEDQLKELHHELPPGFQRLDEKIHEQAGRLSRAASDRDKDLVSFYFSKLANSCTDCHSRYASQRFTGFRLDPPPMPTKKTDHAHHHQKLGQANEFMRKSDFETLVQRFEGPDRKDWQNPDLVVRKLGDLSKKIVADIGAGTGYFSFRLAKRAKKVIAIDIDQRFIDYIDTKNGSLDQKLPIETRLAAFDDPKLNAGEADIVFVVNVYHHIENRPPYFAGVLEKMPEDGRLVIVDFKKEDFPVGPPIDIKLSAATVVQELTEAGFQNIHIDSESLSYQFIVTAW